MALSKLKSKFLDKLDKAQYQYKASQNYSTDTMGDADFGANHPPVVPVVKGTPQVLGLTGDPKLNRDSGGSVRLGGRLFWTWRDTQEIDTKGRVISLPVIASTASWSDLEADGSPSLRSPQHGSHPLRTLVQQQYGHNNLKRAYFPILNHGCDPQAGGSADGTRRAIWPDAPPLVVHDDGHSSATAYTWIRKCHIRGDLSNVTQNPPTTLYRLDHNYPSDPHALPKVSVVKDHFWRHDEIQYGSYGNLIHQGIAYLFAHWDGITALARVLASSIEDKTKYSYWVNGSWTAAKPSITDRSVNIINSNSGGQGTYYYSEPWQCFVWIGGTVFPGADCYITTAPSPIGPWTQPSKFYSGPGGTFDLPAYSIQAHPSMLRDASENAIYLTYTKCDKDDKGGCTYSTPLVYVEWQ